MLGGNSKPGVPNGSPGVPNGGSGTNGDRRSGWHYAPMSGYGPRLPSIVPPSVESDVRIPPAAPDLLGLLSAYRPYVSAGKGGDTLQQGRARGRQKR